MKKYVPIILAIFLTAFALITFYLSSSIIFDLFGVRAKQGNYVLFVVWANLISSLLYLISAYGFVMIKKWTASVLATSAVILLITFIAFNIHINSGGLHEAKTFGAIIFRFLVTIIFTMLAYFVIKKR
jgi:hypothetical protein